MMLTYFHADWCEPCKTLEVILKNAESNNDDVDVVKVNAKKDSEMNDIPPFYDDGIPLCLFFRNGRFRYHKAGEFNKQFLENAIKLLRPKGIEDATREELEEAILEDPKTKLE